MASGMRIIDMLNYSVEAWPLPQCHNALNYIERRRGMRIGQIAVPLELYKSKAYLVLLVVTCYDNILPRRLMLAIGCLQWEGR